MPRIEIHTSEKGRKLLGGEEFEICGPIEPSRSGGEIFCERAQEEEEEEEEKEKEKVWAGKARVPDHGQTRCCSRSSSTTTTSTTPSDTISPSYV